QVHLQAGRQGQGGRDERPQRGRDQRGRQEGGRRRVREGGRRLTPPVASIRNPPRKGGFYAIIAHRPHISDRGSPCSACPLSPVLWPSCPCRPPPARKKPRSMPPTSRTRMPRCG